MTWLTLFKRTVDWRLASFWSSTNKQLSSQRPLVDFNLSQAFWSLLTLQSRDIFFFFYPKSFFFPPFSHPVRRSQSFLQASSGLHSSLLVFCLFLSRCSVIPFLPCVFNYEPDQCYFNLKAACLLRRPTNSSNTKRIDTWQMNSPVWNHRLCCLEPWLKVHSNHVWKSRHWWTTTAASDIH